MRSQPDPGQRVVVPRGGLDEMIRHRQHGKHRIDRPQARSGWRPAVKGRRTVPTAGDSHVEDQVAALVTSRLAAHAGFVTEPTAAEVRATAADAARQARAVLAALADPDDKLTATAAMRNRIEGAALALETVAGGRPGGVAYRLNTLLTGERSRDQCGMLGEYAAGLAAPRFGAPRTSASSAQRRQPRPAHNS